ncbi:MAG TPA: HD domain-containing phosphohydrolase [Burkholderiales bacterium]|nr:HD domain-containing phosphohydrolase [Burkholderiales bacterium]
MGKRRIVSEELEIGSVLAWDAFDERGRLLLRKGYVVDRNSQIEALIERGLFVQQDPTAAPTKPVAPKPEPTALSCVLEVRHRLEVLSAPNGPRDNFPQQLLGLRRLIAEACRLNEDVALATALLERQGRYSIRHAVDVAVACHSVGPALGIDEPELSSTIAAALTMNMSILHMQDDLQGQQNPLSDTQREVIRRHPETSAALLRDRGVTDKLWLDAVLYHHEAIDGTGYPRGKRGQEIPLAAQLVSLADVYCARISNREYRRGLRPNAALRALFLDQGKKVAEGLINRFIKAIGVFPPGTPVRLENGEIAVVTQRGENAGKPQVCSIMGPRGMPFAVPIKRDTGRATYGVREVVEWNEVGAAPAMQILWGKAAAAQ